VRSIVRDLVLNDYFQLQALGYQWGKETITLARPRKECPRKPVLLL
jgi:hypothetical protein